MFLHGGWLHILGNMWVLWIFGDNVEDRMGPLRFILFYLCCGICAGLVQTFTSGASPVPTIGASGAIAGIMGAYLLLYPRARLIILVPVFFWPFFFDIPAWVFLVFWFFLQFASGSHALLSGSLGGGIAWWAHVGGFLAGMLLLQFFLLRRPARRRFFPDEHGPLGSFYPRHRPFHP